MVLYTLYNTRYIDILIWQNTPRGVKRARESVREKDRKERARKWLWGERMVKSVAPGGLCTDGSTRPATLSLSPAPTTVVGMSTGVTQWYHIVTLIKCSTGPAVDSKIDINLDQIWFHTSLDSWPIWTGVTTCGLNQNSWVSSLDGEARDKEGKSPLWCTNSLTYKPTQIHVALTRDGRRDRVGEEGESLSFWLAPIYFQSVVGRVRLLEKPNQLPMGRSVIENSNRWIIFYYIHLGGKDLESDGKIADKR